MSSRRGPASGWAWSRPQGSRTPFPWRRDVVSVTGSGPSTPKRSCRAVALWACRSGSTGTATCSSRWIRRAAVDAARRLIEEHQVGSLAVSFLWSFRNPDHEFQAVAAIRGAFPSIPVVSGADRQPTIREFERTAYAVLNAYAVAAVPGIDQLSRTLEELGLTVPVLLVHSSGGAMTASEARHAPILLAGSGPAAGVAASLSIAKSAAQQNLVTCDMGGTSFDVAVVTDQRVPRRTRSELAGLLTSLPMVDTESIGAGGGSIAWVDARGMLRVGPHSAGADPGPACYGRGGERSDGHRRPPRAGFPRRRSISRRGHAIGRRRRQGGLRRARCERWGSMPKSAHGGSDDWHSKAWPRRCAPSSTPGD